MRRGRRARRYAVRETHEALTGPFKKRANGAFCGSPKPAKTKGFEAILGLDKCQVVCYTEGTLDGLSGEEEKSDARRDRGNR